MRAALRDVLEEMAAQEAAVQADLAHKAGVITAQQEQICALDGALQVKDSCPKSSAYHCCIVLSS